MRVALIYPPPWKLAAPGEAVDFGRDGPPDGYRPGDLDADFHQIPYGLLQLGAEAIRAGHAVKVLNLSSYPWREVERIVGALEADVVGMSCWTANRRGVALVASLAKQKCPGTLVVVGGPHATPLARELLEHHAAIDLVCKGESDVTFLEVLDAHRAGRPLAGLEGTVARDGARVVVGPKRAAVRNLDELACPHAYFASHIVMTSRGCPWACTFCGAETSWGRGYRSNSVDYVVDLMERALAKLPVKMLQIKDDTFTTNKKHVLALCHAIRARGLQVLWSCDTRVDMLSEELLVAMRLAGCQRLSLGVESGSQKILDAIDKKITLDEIAASTALAKSVGIKVRYYMMLGNRGETAETFRESLAFLERTRPHEAVFSCLSVYPGTRDFDDAERAGWLDRRVYFDETFQELKTPFDASEADTALMNGWFRENAGLRRLYEPTLAEHEAALGKLGDHHAAHMDVAGALHAAGDHARATTHVKRALELGYPCPGLAYNLLACIAKASGDVQAMMDAFTIAARVDPQHHVLIRNVNAAKAWFKNDGLRRGLTLDLDPRHDFLLLERTVQPTLPGPLPEGWDRWDEAPAAEPSARFDKTPDQEGSRRELTARSKLRILG
jgi:anaerobic magnesium-protoporphyrin IX monomethyl ester cyclase